MACSESHLQINIPELRQKMTDSGFLFGKGFLQAVLSYHCAMEELNQGCEILKEMKDSDMTVDGRCFKHLVTAYAKTRSVSAKDMLDIMREYNIKQDIDTFTAIIYFHATRGDMDAIEKTFEQIENEDPISAEDKTIITLQIILPLLQYKFQKQASKTINSIGVIRHPPFRLNAAVHKCANSLLMSGYVDEAFLVFCLPFKRGRSFIQCFHNSEASKKPDGIVRGVELSVKLLTESRVDFRKLFMDSSSASLAFLTRLMKELKQLNYVKDSEELKKSALDNVHQSPWKNLVVVLADMDLPTLKAKADEELKRHVHDPHYGTHTDCVNRILEKTVYQEEAAALDLYRNLLAEESDDPRLPAVKSLGAAYVHTMYLKLGNYPQSLHYLKEMICLSPKYIGNLAKVVSNATVMLKNGYKEGVMESIDFCLQHMDKTSGTIILPKVLPEVLMQLLPPSQAFACLQRFRVHISQSDDHLLKAGLMKSYMMGKDVDLLATAYIAYLNYNRRRDYQICVDVIVQLIKEDREDLVQKGSPFSTSLKKNPTFLKVVMARNSIVIQRLLLNLFRKPKLIDTLLDTLVKSDDIDAMVSFENNLSEAIQNCNRMRKAELLSTLLEFSSQNPDTSLGKCMESITDKLPQLRMYMQ
ncbi:uncharacterized protein LOC132558490 [Ylistrum balloti]|uniref:uncharacterized protein LOC132558490 n=1 Tax=Ylistrum balloti TaxID=509963 RepID=UPI002905DC83|nr:uncharacterized protein LOC132558490 [Ylistrum balloti]